MKTQPKQNETKQHTIICFDIVSFKANFSIRLICVLFYHQIFYLITAIVGFVRHSIGQTIV